jgi:hypothetical protein
VRQRHHLVGTYLNDDTLDIDPAARELALVLGVTLESPIDELIDIATQLTTFRVA